MESDDNSFCVNALDAFESNEVIANNLEISSQSDSDLVLLASNVEEIWLEQIRNAERNQNINDLVLPPNNVDSELVPMVNNTDESILRELVRNDANTFEELFGDLDFLNQDLLDVSCSK